MGACCTKFGTYLLRKEESKVISNGGTPRLNKLEHKQSFIAAPGIEATEATNDLHLAPIDIKENL